MQDVLIFKVLLGSLLLPPGNGLLLLLLAAIFRRGRWGIRFAVLGGVLLLLQSLPLVSGALMTSLEQRAGPVPQTPDGAQAIVILGSGLLRNAVEYGGDTANDRTLIRTRYGAQLAHRWQLPVLVTGGLPTDAVRSEADVMAGILRDEFGVTATWQDAKARDTADNARYSAEILRAAGVKRVLLVTQAFHMPRAVRLFRAAGLEVVPAPTHFRGLSDGPLKMFDLLPQASAMQQSYFALHEWLGIAWAAVSGH